MANELIIDSAPIIQAVTEQVQSAIASAVKTLASTSKKELLTVDDAANEYGQSIFYWRRLIKEKEIPYAKLGKSVRIRRKDIEAFIEDRMIASI